MMGARERAPETAEGGLALMRSGLAQRRRRVVDGDRRAAGTGLFETVMIPLRPAVADADTGYAGAGSHAERERRARMLRTMSRPGAFNVALLDGVTGLGQDGQALFRSGGGSARPGQAGADPVAEDRADARLLVTLPALRRQAGEWHGPAAYGRERVGRQVAEGGVRVVALAHARRCSCRSGSLADRRR